jgi:hypothetical protein
MSKVGGRSESGWLTVTHRDRPAGVLTCSRLTGSCILHGHVACKTSGFVVLFLNKKITHEPFSGCVALIISCHVH